MSAHMNVALPRLTHDLCLLHIVCMSAACGGQACMPRCGAALVVSVMVCSVCLIGVIPVQRSPVISYHNMTLPGPEGRSLHRKNNGAQ